MARIPYLTLADMKREAPDIYDYFHAVRGKDPSATHMLMANAPSLLRPFLGLADAVQKTSLDRKQRELVQMMISYIAGKDYVWTHHYKRALSFGITEDQLASLGSFETSPLFTDEERILLRYTWEAMHFHVTDETFEAARELLGSDGRMMEFIMTVAFFNFSTYVHLPCEIDIEPPFQSIPKATEMARPAAPLR